MHPPTTTVCGGSHICLVASLDHAPPEAVIRAAKIETIGTRKGVRVLGRRITHRLSVPGRSRGTRVLAGLAVLVLVAGLTVVLVAPRVQVSATSPLSSLPLIGRPPTVTAAPPSPVAAQTLITPAPATAPVPGPAALTAVLRPLAAAPALGALSGEVTDARSGTVLWSVEPNIPRVPASTMKVLTAAAALLTLGRADTTPTRVVATSTPGQVVLVGGGDVTLSNQPPGSPTYYPSAPRMSDLVAQVRASGVAVRSVVVDASRWSGPLLAQGWFAADVAGGNTAPVQPVMLDGARLRPLQDYSPRSSTPALDAGRALAAGLGVAPGAVSAGTAPADARVVAEVSSATLQIRAQFMLTTSDELEAEAIGREVALATQAPPTFTGVAAAVRGALAGAGFDVTGLAGFDASGLSVDDRVPVRLLAAVLTAAAGEGPHADALRPLLSWLPVAGATGTLADRYTGSAAGAGYVRAKTGTLTGVSSLAGTVLDTDGRVLVFALMSAGTAPADARPALDALADTLRGCGCR